MEGAVLQYRTIASPSEGLYKEKGSKFLGFAFPVTNESDINQRLEELRKLHHQGRHHCYGWVLGVDDIRMRANDDGEPTYSAGKPILSQIEKLELTGTLVVVVRYFGGTKLGVGGLIQAYRAAAEAALNQSHILTLDVVSSYQLLFPYAAMNDVMSLVKQLELETSAHKFELSCEMRVKVPREKLESFTKGSAEIQELRLNKLQDD
ncbi:MAG: YigZ family protein [Cryomorphaceae bacterium]|nr:MAG: YigZ family protein [Cryomorphaceae bacterium]